jgi:hypothetical protein
LAPGKVKSRGHCNLHKWKGIWTKIGGHFQIFGISAAGKNVDYLFKMNKNTIRHPIPAHL